MEVFWTSFFSITRFGSLIARSPGMRRALMGTLCLLVTGFSIGSAMHQFSQLRHVSKHFCATAVIWQELRHRNGWRRYCYSIA